MNLYKYLDEYISGEFIRQDGNLLYVRMFQIEPSNIPTIPVRYNTQLRLFVGIPGSKEDILFQETDLIPFADKPHISIYKLISSLLIGRDFLNFEITGWEIKAPIGLFNQTTIIIHHGGTASEVLLTEELDI